MLRIIAICGGKRCGKDTIAQHISTKYGHEHVKIASKLKDIVRVLFDFTTDQLESNMKDVKDNRWGISPREAMQFLGTDIMQLEIQKLLPTVGRSFWIRGALKNYGYAASRPIVISDLRFLHEYRELVHMQQKEVYEKNDLLIIRVTRQNMENNDHHVSEQEYLQIPVDVIISNDGSIQDLLRKVDDAVANKLIQSNRMTR